MLVSITNGDGKTTTHVVEDAIEKLKGYVTGDIEFEECIDVLNAYLNTSKNLLYNTIVLLFDESLTEYSGLDDEDFIHTVCKNVGISRAEYFEIMHIVSEGK